MQRLGGAQVEVGEVVDDALVPPVLFVDLQDASVLLVGRGKYARRLALQEQGGVGTTAVHEAADD
jgi:hypothetical protein